VWRDAAALPEALIFNGNYLGGSMATFNLNFSRPGGQIITQYYTFVRLGYEGYRRVHTTAYDTARHLSREIEGMGPFAIIYDGNPAAGITAVTWRLHPDQQHIFSLFDFAEKLRARGWLVPAYTLPADRDDLAVQRIIVRHGFSHDMADMLLLDMRRALTAWPRRRRRRRRPRTCRCRSATTRLRPSCERHQCGAARRTDRVAGRAEVPPRPSTPRT
jgi:glutamate decarboxylase